MMVALVPSRVIKRVNTAGEPGLLVARFSGRSVVVEDLFEARVPRELFPGIEVVEGGVLRAVPAFLVGAARVGTEEHAAWAQAVSQFSQHAHDLLARDVKEAGIRKHPVEVPIREIQRQEILQPDFTFRIGARHPGEAGGTFEPDGVVSAPFQIRQVAAWAAAEIQDPGGRGNPQFREQGLDILRDVVAARALPEGLRPRIVIGQGSARNLA